MDPLPSARPDPAPTPRADDAVFATPAPTARAAAGAGHLSTKANQASIGLVAGAFTAAGVLLIGVWFLYRRVKHLEALASARAPPGAAEEHVQLAEVSFAEDVKGRSPSTALVSKAVEAVPIGDDGTYLAPIDDDELYEAL